MEHDVRHGRPELLHRRLGHSSLLSKETRSALGCEGSKAAARKRGASKGTGSGAVAMTVTELRREAAKLGIDGRGSSSS